MNSNLGDEVVRTMKVIWSVNTIIATAAKLFGLGGTASVSWIDHASELVGKRAELIILFPTNAVRQIEKADFNGIQYYALPRSSKNGYDYEDSLTELYRQIITETAPDVIQQWGTEFPNAWNLMQASELCGMLDRTVVHIQGLISVVSRPEHFYADLPETILHHRTIKEYFTNNHLSGFRKKLEKRGEYEVRILQKAKHVIGRTEFDRTCVRLYHKDITYHHGGEVLRAPFYQTTWDYDTCEHFRIFMSQGGIPYKGMHFALEALQIVLREYPKAHLYVTGRDLSPDRGWKEKLRYSSYELYLSQQIKALGLENAVTFLGGLDAEEMCVQYQKANVFILPSTIDNSPNSLGEAMVIGTPVVAAMVGGVRDLCTEEVLLYQHNASYMLAEGIMQIFRASKEELDHRTKNAKRHAQYCFDPKKNVEDLFGIYQTISGQ